jgi:hypothetical protein
MLDWIKWTLKKDSVEQDRKHHQPYDVNQRAAKILHELMQSRSPPAPSIDSLRNVLGRSPVQDADLEEQLGAIFTIEGWKANS